MEWPNNYYYCLVFFFFFAPLLCLAERTTYIVHLDKSLMPNVFATHHHWHSSTIESIKIATPASLNSHHPAPKLLYSYDNVFHGFSAVLSKDEVEALKKSPGFVSAYKDIPVELHTTHTPDFLKLNPSSGLWPASGFGQDVIIGVVDTGIWPESPSFRDDGMPEIPKRWKGICRAGTDFNSSLCNRKIIGVNYFYEGAQAANTHENITTISARDSWGHGTHIASIAAGNYAQGVSYFGYGKGTARGVAPHARLAIYKVSWRQFGTYTADVLAGMDQAVADGVDILSMSIGFAHVPLDRDAIAIGAFGAMMKGIFVTGSAGNRGPDYGTVVNGVPWIMTVASGTTDRTFAGTLTLGNGQKIRGWSLFPLRAIIKHSPVMYNKTLSFCNSTDVLSQVSSPINNVIVCDGPKEIILDDGSNVFHDQMRSVTEAGLLAAIFISSDPRAHTYKSFTNPGVVISPKEGKLVKDYIRKTEHPTVSISFQETYDDVTPAPKLAWSSGRGPARSYLGIAKPDIMAPGVSILGAWPPEISAISIGRGMDLGSDYNTLSGSSLASPHVSGIAAMLKSVHPEWSPSAIKSAMMTTANPLDNTQNRIIVADTNKPTTPLDTGSGFVDPNRALDPGLIYDATPQDYVNLLCSMNLTEAEFKTIARSSANCSNPSDDLNYPSFIALYEFDREGNKYPWLVKKFTRTVTNVGSGAAKYTAKVEVPKNARISVTPQVLAFGKKYEKKSYSLTIRYRGEGHEVYVFNYGSITWIEENGNHTVRSPISVSPIIFPWGY
ncbi:Subtilisin-like protease sbt3 [Datura stramonium]|uniref:Subtilisin-like protease sbt3 n=1 Tax=Datura stramonium TaxID=4076 RepID=A0ABS8UN71_DATST|nr:Subtilisin-like protease sbt3 [Datura stramonium]